MSYDSNGNILSDGFHNYTWDGEGKLATLDSKVAKGRWSSDRTVRGLRIAASTTTHV